MLGASGTTGQQVVKDLESEDVNIRITSRKEEVVKQLQNQGKDCHYLDLDECYSYGKANWEMSFLESQLFLRL